MTTAAFLDSQNRLHREAVSGECPHCGNTTHFSLMACPGFARLQAERPARVGIVLQCDACRMPLFLRYRVRAWLPDRIEFQPGPEAMERPPEHFGYAHLPEPVATVFREALACYSAGLHQAFALLSRATIQAVLDDLGERNRLKLFDQVAEVRTLAGIDASVFDVVRRVLFEGEPPRGQAAGPLTRLQAAVLLETLKDLLYQSYIRRARLQQALRLRQFPAAEAARPPPALTVRSLER